MGVAGYWLWAGRLHPRYGMDVDEMNYRQRMMNIPLGDLIADSGQYRNGHRDARHAAAEIANEADAEVERLREVMAGVRARLNPDYKP